MAHEGVVLLLVKELYFEVRIAFKVFNLAQSGAWYGVVLGLG